MSGGLLKALLLQLMDRKASCTGQQIDKFVLQNAFTNNIAFSVSQKLFLKE